VNNIIIRKLANQDYEGVSRVDILIQKQYLGEKWKKLSPVEKEEHLVSRQSEFEINVRSRYGFVACLNN